MNHILQLRAYAYASSQSSFYSSSLGASRLLHAYRSMYIEGDLVV